jgi:hypothetical protein
VYVSAGAVSMQAFVSKERKSGAYAIKLFKGLTIYATTREPLMKGKAKYS